MKINIVQQAVLTARGRMMQQHGWQALNAALVIGLAASCTWFVLQPLLLVTPVLWLRWAVLAGCVCLASAIALWHTLHHQPTLEAAALEVDQRLKLRERVVTVTALSPEQAATPAGAALLADTEAKLGDKTIAQEFPIRLPRAALLTPLSLIVLVSIGTFWNPQPLDFETLLASEKKPATEKVKADAFTAKKPAVEQKPETRANDKDRAGKILAEIEAEFKKLDEKYDKTDLDNNPELARQKTAELTKLEDKAEKAVKQQEMELKNLADRLARLESVAKQNNNPDGPAKDTNEALAKGDTQKAEKALLDWAKKIEDDELTKKDQGELAAQLEAMKNALEEQKADAEKVNREKEEKLDQLKKDIEEARKDGRDKEADALERDLENAQAADPNTPEELGDIADAINEAAEAMKRGDKQATSQAMKRAAQQAAAMGKGTDQLAKLEGQLQRLRRDRKLTAGKCDCKGTEGELDRLDPEKLSASKNSKGGGIGAGERALNDQAKGTAEETRVRSLQDLQGKSSYGGLTKGNGFVKKTEKELGGTIQKAVQDATGTSDVQSLPREARDSVADYFKKLGDAEKKK